jgi:hypothetical protein
MSASRRVTTATTQLEQTTNTFCGNFQTVPSTSGSSVEGIRKQEDWTLFEADGKAYLVRWRAPVQPGYGLTLRSLGVSGFELSDGTTTVLLDPTPTRPDPWAL